MTSILFCLGEGSSEKFVVCQASTGRHCLLGGAGEQCDLWDEGKWSEFGPFGPGVTLYFKFLKWLFWVSLFLAFFGGFKAYNICSVNHLKIL